MSLDPCSEFSSCSFDPSYCSPPPIAPKPLAATLDTVPQPPPYTPSSLTTTQVQADFEAPNSPPQPVPEISSESSAPPYTLRVPRLYPDLPRSPPLQFSSVAQSCPTLCDPMNRSTPGLPVHHQLLEFTQTHVHRVSGAIQPSHPLSLPCPPALNPSQHQGLFQGENSSHEVAKVLEFQIQHQSFQ